MSPRQWAPASPASADPPARLLGLLAENERVVHAQRDHPAFLALPLTVLFAALGLVVHVSGHAGAAGARMLWFIWLGVFCWAVFRFWEWTRRWFVVTDKRIMRSEGTLQTRTSQLMIGLGRDITIEQSLLGEIFGFGSFRVESAKDEHPLRVVHWLARPDRLYRAISATVQAGAARGVPGTVVAPIIGGDGDGGGIIMVDQGSRNPTQRIEAGPRPPRQAPTSRRPPDKGAPSPLRRPRRRGSPHPAGGSLGGLGFIKNAGLFRRRR